MPRSARSRIPYPRKDKSWELLLGLGADFTADVIATGGTLTPAEKITVMRTMGQILIAPTASVVATDECSIAVGIGVFPTSLSTGSQFPAPQTDLSFPWIYREDFSFYFTAVADAGEEPRALRTKFDIKTRRIVSPGQRIVLLVQYVNVSGNPPMTASVGPVRMLFAE